MQSDVLRNTQELINVQWDSPQGSFRPLARGFHLVQSLGKPHPVRHNFLKTSQFQKQNILQFLKLTRALLTQRLLLLALELACTMEAWPLLEASLRIKCMHIREKRLEPIWNFTEIPLSLHQFLISHYLETMPITASGKFLGKFLSFFFFLL